MPKFQIPHAVIESRQELTKPISPHGAISRLKTEVMCWELVNRLPLCGSGEMWGPDVWEGRMGIVFNLLPVSSSLVYDSCNAVDVYPEHNRFESR
jgi:hypothetical protein